MAFGLFNRLAKIKLPCRAIEGGAVIPYGVLKLKLEPPQLFLSIRRRISSTRLMAEYGFIGK